jgi:flavorubredoxin
MSTNHISDSILYLGVDDNDLVLFENQYSVQPMGVSYNSYLIRDEKLTIMDTVDQRATDQWLVNVRNALGTDDPDYLVVTHMEPDHGANVARLSELYPSMKIVGNAKTLTMLEQFFGVGTIPKERTVCVSDGESLSLGSHTLTFLFAPMVHWPEVMVVYESSEKVLFSADAFGRFGSLSKTSEAPWVPQARRYYFNIVGKYGAQVQSLLKKVSPLDISTICPLHGPVLTGNLAPYLEAYDSWSRYQPDQPDAIFLAYASIHGNTAKAAHLLAQKLADRGAMVFPCNLVGSDLSYDVTNAFTCGKLILACPTYDGNLFPPMEEFLTHLETKNFQNRTVGIVENGSWMPMAGKLMTARLEKLKNITLCQNKVTIKSALNPQSEAQLDALVQEILG